MERVVDKAHGAVASGESKDGNTVPGAPCAPSVHPLTYGRHECTNYSPAWFTGRWREEPGRRGGNSRSSRRAAGHMEEGPLMAADPVPGGRPAEGARLPFVDGIATIYYHERGTSTQLSWSVACDVSTDNETTLRAHLMRWRPTCVFDWVEIRAVQSAAGDDEEEGAR